MLNTCYVVGAGNFTPRGLNVREHDFVIAADGGYGSLCGIGITADLLVGDFDSINALPAGNIPTKRFPVEKDDTDIGIALREGYKLGYRSFMMYGAGGGRIDHYIANIQLLCRYSRMGCEMRLVDTECDIYALTNGTLCLPSCKKGTLVSVFCSGDSAEGVTLLRLKYPLDNAVLTCDMPLGISNEYASNDAACVTVRKGTLYIIVHI